MAEEAVGKEPSGVLRKVMEGAFISLVGVLAIGMFQVFNNNLTDLRSENSKLGRELSEAVKKPEFEARVLALWTAQREAAGLREKIAVLEQQAKAGQEEYKDLAKQVQALREKVVVMEKLSSAGSR